MKLTFHHRGQSEAKGSDGTLQYQALENDLHPPSVKSSLSRPRNFFLPPSKTSEPEPPIDNKQSDTVQTQSVHNALKLHSQKEKKKGYIQTSYYLECIEDEMDVQFLKGSHKVERLESLKKKDKRLFDDLPTVYHTLEDAMPVENYFDTEAKTNKRISSEKALYVSGGGGLKKYYNIRDLRENTENWAPGEHAHFIKKVKSNLRRKEQDKKNQERPFCIPPVEIIPPNALLAIEQSTAIEGKKRYLKNLNLQSLDRYNLLVASSMDNKNSSLTLQTETPPSGGGNLEIMRERWSAKGERSGRRQNNPAMREEDRKKKDLMAREEKNLTRKYYVVRNMCEQEKNNRILNYLNYDLIQKNKEATNGFIRKIMNEYKNIKRMYERIDAKKNEVDLENQRSISSSNIVPSAFIISKRELSMINPNDVTSVGNVICPKPSSTIAKRSERKSGEQGRTEPEYSVSDERARGGKGERSVRDEARGEEKRVEDGRLSEERSRSDEGRYYYNNIKSLLETKKQIVANARMYSQSISDLENKLMHHTENYIQKKINNSNLLQALYNS